MKKSILLVSLLMSHSVWAAQCKVDIKNEIHLDGQTLEIQQTSGEKAVFDDSNNLYIRGEKVELDAEQQAAVEQYRDSMNEYLPRAKQIASEGLALANDIVDDVAQSLDAPGAFDDVKASMQAFFADIEARYYQDGDLVLPAESFESMAASWAEDFEKAKQLFNQEFISSAFNAMSEKMKQDGGLNLTELADSMAELKVRVEERLKEHSAEIKQQGEELCESLDDIAEQELELHEKIPELKDYQTFTI
ncbi:YggN family protein [Vibrio paucivorans]|uniref:YggN family protein n=1 Tax=Vibrio paucivorans TaxID=2829489 RepID=A0A9X3CG98_9VIBR|nr:YggN family protein [Vibrio paucivorans]MCW8335145.1 YggN family protein [Vibrio paucivorans]